MDKDYPKKSGILTQYAHLTSYELAMPVIRKLLGLSEYGRMPDNPLGRILQRFVDNAGKDASSEGRIIEHAPLE